MTPKITSRGSWIDISVPLTDGMVGWPEDPPVRIERIEDVERGDSQTLSLLSLGSHSGTHIDAAAHIIKDGITVDKIPLANLIGTARVIEIADPGSVKASELRRYRIRKGERILIKTNNSELWHRSKTFTKDFIYMTLEAALYFTEHGVSLIGIDYLSIGGYDTEGDEVHRVLLGAGIPIVEGLDLSNVTAGRYDLVCLPLNILNGDGAPARVAVRRRH